MQKFVLMIVLLASGAVFAMEPCSTRMANAASMTLAETVKYRVQDIRVVRVDQGMWTEMPAENSGSGEVAVRRLYSDKISYYTVSAKQVGNTADCTVSDIQSLSADQIDPMVKKAEKYKVAIGDTTYMSEADYPWEVVASRLAVMENALTAEIALALNLDPNATEVYSHEDAVRLLKSRSENTEDYLESLSYKQLLEAMLQDHSKLMLIRSGEIEVKVYIVGRDSSGRLVGVRTISVET